MNEYYFYEDGRDKDFATWYQVTGLFFLIFYLIKSLSTYYKYRTITFNVLSFADLVMFRWAKRFLIAFLLLIALRIIFFIANPEWAEFGNKFWYYLSFSILFYYVSISGYTNSMLSSVSFKDATIEADTQLKFNIKNPNEIEFPNPSAEENNEIEDLNDWKVKVEKLMLKDKMYENPGLIISDLSTKLDTHSKKISQVVNQGFNMNFNDFVNDYRIKAVIQKIKAGEHHHKTLLGVAFECGFNSKSTFNRAFKRHAAFSPKEYIEKNDLK